MAISASFLQAHGIQLGQGELERLFMDAVQRFSCLTRADSTQLDDIELAALARGGLADESDFSDQEAVDPLGQSAAEYAALVATSLPASAVAKVLAVDSSRVRQRLGANPRTLFGIKHRRSWRLPRFQFDDSITGLIPGIEEVLPHLDPALHPLSVVMWFTVPHSDLLKPDSGECLSPRDWLRLGYPPATAAVLAADL
jgi:hypothetical protein